MHYEHRSILVTGNQAFDKAMTRAAVDRRRKRGPDRPPTPATTKKDADSRCWRQSQSGYQRKYLQRSRIEIIISSLPVGASHSDGCRRSHPDWTEGAEHMKCILRVAMVGAAILSLPAAASAQCTNHASSCSGARSVCFSNMKKAGLDPGACHGWYAQCMKTGRWDTNTCSRGGLKRS